MSALAAGGRMHLHSSFTSRGENAARLSSRRSAVASKRKSRRLSTRGKLLWLAGAVMVIGGATLFGFHTWAVVAQGTGPIAKGVSQPNSAMPKGTNEIPRPDVIGLEIEKLDHS